MLPDDVLKEALPLFNRLLKAALPDIPDGRRNSTKYPFTAELPARRSKPGTDEKLKRPPKTAGNGKSRNAPAVEEPDVHDEINRLRDRCKKNGYDLTEPTNDFETLGTTEAPKKTKKSAIDNRMYLSAMPDHGMIGHAEAELVLRDAVKGFLTRDSVKEKLGFAMVLLTIGCVCPFSEVHHLELSDDGVHIIRTPPHDPNPADLGAQSLLNIPTIYQIHFGVPELLRSALKLLRENSEFRPDTRTVNALLKGITPFVTVSGIESYLRWTGPDHWHYSPVIPEFSFRGVSKRGVSASYICASEIFRSMTTLYLFIDPSYSAPIVNPNSYGCDHVPKLEEIREYYATWMRSWALPIKTQPIPEIIAWHDGFVAGLHQLGCVFFGGLRNYLGAPPEHAVLPASFIVNKEKLIAVPILWSAFLRRGLVHYELVMAEVEQRLAAEGFTVSWPARDAYCFLRLKGSAHYVPAPVDAGASKSALQNYAPLARWADLHTNALRACGMTLLYDRANYHSDDVEAFTPHSHDIEAFYGRAMDSLSHLRKHRFEDPSMFHARRAIEKELLRLIQ